MSPARAAAFQLWTSVIGLIASAITIYLFAVGLITLDVLPPLLRKPVPLSAVSFVFLFYFSVLIIYAICSRRKAHWAVDEVGNYATEQPFFYYGLITLLVWFPIYILWAILTYEINDLAKLPSYSLHDTVKYLYFGAPFTTMAIWFGLAGADASNRNEHRDRINAARDGFTPHDHTPSPK